MSPKLFKLQVVVPERVVYDGSISMLMVPGQEGELAVLCGHESLTTSLSCGIIAIYKEGCEKMKIEGGVMHVDSNKCVIITVAAKYLDGDEV